MNCCNKDDESKEPGEVSDQVQGNKMKHKGPMSHMWMMVLCCGIPIALFLLLPLFGISLFKGALIGIFPFICLIMMMIMMPMMMKRNNCDTHQENKREIKSIESKPLV
jgi:purine-cytosine permease-like protein